METPNQMRVYNNNYYAILEDRIRRKKDTQTSQNVKRMFILRFSNGWHL